MARNLWESNFEAYVDVGRSSLVHASIPEDGESPNPKVAGRAGAVPPRSIRGSAAVNRRRRTEAALNQMALWAVLQA